MPNFRYTVINPENKELSGVIGATDEKSAREELNQLGFSIVRMEIDEDENIAADNHQTSQTVNKFEFAAIDKNNKHVAGTIQGTDLYAAYKRLVKEYSFEVAYLINANLSETEKTSERQKGVFELQNRLDEEDLLERKKSSKDTFDFKAFTQEQEVLGRQVDFVLNKVRSMLDEYGEEIRMDTKAKIRQMVDKILRIKSSTNLDYIRKSCEDLLKYLQQEELFLHEESKQKEHAKLSLEAKTMMIDLHHQGNQQQNDIFDSLREWREQHIVNNKNRKISEYLINFIISFVIGFIPENEEIAALRKNIKTINQQFRQYLLLYFQASNPELKMETREALKKLWQNRKQQLKKLKGAKKARALEFKKHESLTHLEKFGNEILSFSGWLLTFYLGYYFVSLMLTQKNFGIKQLPPSFDFYHSVFLKYFLAVFFLFYAVLSMKINFFRRNQIATVIMAPLWFIGSCIIILNF